jgi:ribosomal protein S18 acetylase RimI-like enzyme
MGAFRPQLVGAVGLYRDRHLKSSHKMHLWGLYVTSSHRRQGVASHLLNAVLRHAAYLPGVSWVHLKVSVATPGALRLYEKGGVPCVGHGAGGGGPLRRPDGCRPPHGFVPGAGP